MTAHDPPTLADIRTSGLRRLLIGTADVFQPLAATLQIGVGVLGIVGWHLQREWMIRLSDGLPPIHYPAAVCFLLAGISLGALLLGHRRVATVLGFPVLLIGLVTLAEVMTGVDTGLSRLGPTDWLHGVDAGQPGQMAPDSAVCFVCAGAALIATSLRTFVGRGVFVAVCGVFIWALSVSAILGYMTGLPMTTPFGHFNRMPLHGAIVFYFFGGGMAVRALRKTPVGAPTLPRCAALLVATAATTVTLSFWHGLIILQPNARHAFSLLFLLGSLFLTGALSWAVHQNLLAWQRNAAVVDANRTLSDEVRRREHAEGEARGNELRWRTVLEGVGDAIVGVDAEGRIKLVNAAAESMFGFERAELLGREIEMLIPERYRPTHVGQRDGYTHAPRTRAMGARLDLFGRRRDGSEVPVEISLSPIQDGGDMLVLTVIRDVSERKAQERRESTMLRALATIGESATILAHEIKNPLTAVNAALKTLAAKLGMEQAAVLEDLVDRMRRVEMMIRRTLSFTKPVEMRFAQVAVADLVAHALGDARTVLMSRPVQTSTLVEPTDLHITVDPHLVREVIVNLVANAAEALPGEGHIRVTARRQKNPDRVLLVVEDDGPGLPDSMRANPFRPFVTTKVSGTGIGLPICKKFVEEHGGTIAYSDAAPHGARWSITLPLTPGPRR